MTALVALLVVSGATAHTHPRALPQIYGKLYPCKWGMGRGGVGEETEHHLAAAGGSSWGGAAITP